MGRKETPMKAFAGALVSQEWFKSMKKEYLQEITRQEVSKTFYSPQILCKNEFVNNKGTTVDFLRRMIDIRTREGQITYLFIGSFIIAGGYALCSPHFTTRSFFGRPLLAAKAMKSLVPVVGQAMPPVVIEAVVRVLVNQTICKAVEYSAELAMGREMSTLVRIMLPVMAEPGMSPIIEGMIYTSVLKNGRLNRNFGGLNFTKFNKTPNL